MRTEQQLATGRPSAVKRGWCGGDRCSGQRCSTRGAACALALFAAACTLASKDEAFGIVEPVNVTSACVTKAGAFSGQSVRGPAERTVRAPHRLQLDARARRRRALRLLALIGAVVLASVRKRPFAAGRHLLRNIALSTCDQCTQRTRSDARAGPRASGLLSEASASASSHRAICGAGARGPAAAISDAGGGIWRRCDGRGAPQFLACGPPGRRGGLGNRRCVLRGDVAI